MINSSFEEILEKEGRLIYSNVGDSMKPLIRQGRDIIVIEKPKGRLKKYDIPLYRRDSGQYVLHRILRVRKNDYVLCGDNRTAKETGITDRHIKGVLTKIIRDGRTVEMNSLPMKIYSHLWCDLFPLRALILRSAHAFKKIAKRLKR